jgi:hypothetical protein
MASEAQIAANQRNALKSTGPQTAAGKAAVGRNALRHGLCSERVVIFEESAEDFDEFAAGIQAVLAPADAYETALAERIVQIEWRLRRVWRMEAAAIDAEAAAADRERARKAAGSALFVDWTAKRPTGPQAPTIEQARRAMRDVAGGWNDDELQATASRSARGRPGRRPRNGPKNSPRWGATRPRSSASSTARRGRSNAARRSAARTSAPAHPPPNPRPRRKRPSLRRNRPCARRRPPSMPRRRS